MIRKYYDDQLLRCEEYCYKHPGELELMEIFPEGKKMIRDKIKDWEKEKETLLKTESIPLFKKINATAKDEFSRLFWKKAYMALSGRRKQILANLTRLRRLKALTTKPKLRKGYESFNMDKAQAKEKPIQDLYAFQKLRRVGRRYIACCPFHNDKTPSFIIFPDNNFRCFGCGESGDSITFMQKLRGYTFPEAVATLAGVR